MRELVDVVRHRGNKPQCLRMFRNQNFNRAINNNIIYQITQRHAVFIGCGGEIFFLARF